MSTTNPLQNCRTADIEGFLSQGLCELTGRFAEVKLVNAQYSSATPDHAGEAVLQIRVLLRHLPPPEGE